MFRFFVLAFVLVASVFAASIERPNENGRIIGGEETSIEKHPYQVSVRLDTYIYLHICGGALYAPRIVITAAHCIKGRYASYIRIVAGKSNIDDPTEEGVRVSKLIPHALYSKKTHEYDVGLIILREPLVYSPSIQPIALAQSYPSAGSMAVVTGWGKNSAEATTLTNNLQQVSVEIIAHDVCQIRYLAKQASITDQMLCAGIDEGGKDTCQGDSGGPLVFNGQLIGIVSWGESCALAEYPGVYASVQFHKNWIVQTAELYM